MHEARGEYHPRTRTPATSSHELSRISHAPGGCYFEGVATIGEVRWGGYKEFEGAYFLGTKPFRLPRDADENHRILDVITTTEGGTADAINAYDRCIVSVGYIQWCEASYFLTSKLLGHIARYDRRLLDPLAPALEASRAEFVDTGAGKWRFRFRDPRRDIDTAVEQQELFLLHSNGQRGTWDDESREHVKRWVACLANVLADDRAIPLQVAYTAERVTSFATPSARALLWDGTPNEGYPGALRAAFLSFAANLPAVAAHGLATAAAKLTAKKWSREWCTGVLKELTFGPNISIYPSRYQRIRSKLEANWALISRIYPRSWPPSKRRIRLLWMNRRSRAPYRCKSC